MKTFRLLFIMAVAFSLTSCYTRIDAGHEGIKVNLYGDSKGVDDVELVTGAVCSTRSRQPCMSILLLSRL